MEMMPGYKQTEVGIIPEDWEVVLLDSVAKRGSGHTPNKKHPEYWGGQIKWISLQDSDRLDHLYIYDTAVKITPAGIANSSATMHAAGTVVLSRDAGVGKSTIMKDDMAVSQHFMAWRCGPNLDNHFLYYWLQSKKAEFERIAMGSTIKTIGLPYFKQLVCQLPTKAEQEAIAKVLSKADALIETLERLIAKKRLLKKGVMQQLLTGRRRLNGFANATPGYKQTEVGVIPEDWEVKAHGDLFDFSGGLSASRDQLSSEGYCYLHYGDIHKSSKTFIDVQAEYQDIPKLNVPLKRVSPGVLLNDGDVVFVDASEDDEGTSKHVVIVNKENIPYISGLHTIVAKNKSVALDHIYRRYCFQTANIKRQFRYFAVGTKVSGISKTNIAKVGLPVPPLPEQEAIGNILSAMDAEIALLEAQLAKYRHLKQGLMQKLLTGRIRLV